MIEATEIAQKWRKSSFSQNGDCVEVMPEDGKLLVRDSKNPDDPALAFTRQEWAAFLTQVRKSELY